MVKYLKQFDFRKWNTTIKIETSQSTIYNFSPDNENAFITLENDIIKSITSEILNWQKFSL